MLGLNSAILIVIPTAKRISALKVLLWEIVPQTAFLKDSQLGGPTQNACLKLSLNCYI